MPPSRLKPGHPSPFESMPAGGWRPTRKRPAMKRELTDAPPSAKDDEAPQDTPDNGVASHGAASSRKV